MLVTRFGLATPTRRENATPCCTSVGNTNSECQINWYVCKNHPMCTCVCDLEEETIRVPGTYHAHITRYRAVTQDDMSRNQTSWSTFAFAVWRMLLSPGHTAPVISDIVSPCHNRQLLFLTLAATLLLRHLPKPRYLRLSFFDIVAMLLQPSPPSQKALFDLVCAAPQ